MGQSNEARTLAVSAPSSKENRTGRAILRVQSGNNLGLVYIVEEPGLTIGRGLDAGVRLSDDGISRAHTQIKIDQSGRASAVDLGSRNGTYVNGTRVDQEPLRDGDILSLGRNTTLAFRYEYGESSTAEFDREPQSGITSILRRVATTLENVGRTLEQNGQQDDAKEAFRSSNAVRREHDDRNDT